MTMPKNPDTYELFYRILFDKLSSEQSTTLDEFFIPTESESEAVKMRLRYYAFVRSFDLRANQELFEARKHRILDLEEKALAKLAKIKLSRKFELKLGKGDGTEKENFGILCVDRDKKYAKITEFMLRDLMESEERYEAEIAQYRNLGEDPFEALLRERNSAIGERNRASPTPPPTASPTARGKDVEGTPQGDREDPYM